MRLDYEFKKTEDAIRGLLLHFNETLPTEEYNKLIVLIRQANNRGALASEIQRRGIRSRLMKEDDDD